MMDGSLANSPSSLSAAGQDEQPWLVNNSMTVRGSARAEPVPTNPRAITIAKSAPP